MKLTFNFTAKSIPTLKFSIFKFHPCPIPPVMFKMVLSSPGNFIKLYLQPVHFLPLFSSSFPGIIISHFNHCNSIHVDFLTYVLGSL